MSETKGQTKARLHCANYDSTDKTCLGIMLKVEKIKDEMSQTGILKINPDGKVEMI